MPPVEWKPMLQGRRVIKVGSGRGIIIHDRGKMPPFLGKRMFQDRRIVITAAHCLPRFPPCYAANLPYVKMYESLLGTLDAPEPAVCAECLFVDPIADIALLGRPDPQAVDEHGKPYDERTDEYYALTEEAPSLRIGKAPPQRRAWMLALDGDWIPVAVHWSDNRLFIEGTPKNEPGVSGSPLLADDGAAFDWCALARTHVARWRTANWNGAGPIPCWRVTCQGGSCKAPAWLPQLRRDATP